MHFLATLAVLYKSTMNARPPERQQQQRGVDYEY